MREITLDPADILSDEEAEKMGGELAFDESWYTLLIDDEARVVKPDGSTLGILRKDVLSLQHAEAAFDNLMSAAVLTDNRGMSAGKYDPSRLLPWMRAGHITRDGEGTRWSPMKQDSTVSKQNRAIPVRSGIVGYFDRSTRFPYCRTTAYNLKHPDRWNAALPFIREINQVFKETHPKRYALQHEAVRNTSPDFVVEDTAFSTVTVNLNWQTAVHKDVGDYEAGFGVMTALCSDNFDGAYLCFPQYRCAFNMRTLDVLIADVHEWHCNTPFHGVPGTYRRLSFVLYYRRKLAYCGSAAEELDRAKGRKGQLGAHDESYNTEETVDIGKG